GIVSVERWRHDGHVIVDRSSTIVSLPCLLGHFPTAAENNVLRGIVDNIPLPAYHARGAFLVVLSSRLRPIRYAILYRLSGVHQLFMAAQRRALKERTGRPAPFIEHHNDVGWPVRTLVRIRD